MTREHTLPIRVLIVGPSLQEPGGQAVQARRLLTGLAESEIVSATFLPVNPKLTGFLGALQRIKYIRTIVTSAVYLISLLRVVPKADVVHAFSASYFSYLLAPLPAMAVARIFRKRTVLNYRSGEADDHLENWPLTARPSMRVLADKIIAPSGYLVEVFRKHGLLASSISNFVPIDRLPYRRREFLTPNFLSNRNHESLYNVSCTIRAFARIREIFPTARLTVAGDGSERPKLEQLAAALRLTESIIFIGRVSPDEMGALYDAADIYLNSPNIDNMPGSIVEAFACGLAVVSTNAGGIPYVVTQGVTGILCECDDDAALANAAVRLLQDPTLGAEITAAARVECETRYVWPAVKAQWEQLYEELVH